MMAAVLHVTSGLGVRKFQDDGFLLTRVYTPATRSHVGLVLAKWWRRDNRILVNRRCASELLLARRS